MGPDPRMTDGLRRILGDTPGRTVIKLVIFSLVAGFIMRSLDIYPYDILFWIREFLGDIWNSGFLALGKVGDYLLLGAVVVIPLFILVRIMNWRKS